MTDASCATPEACPPARGRSRAYRLEAGRDLLSRRTQRCWLFVGCVKRTGVWSPPTNWCVSRTLQKSIKTVPTRSGDGPVDVTYEAARTTPPSRHIVIIYHH
jgi:hypothetical protein